MKARKYYQMSTEAMFPVKKVFKTSCCDCGLVHLWTLRTVAGVPQFHVVVDNRATGQMRRKMVKDGTIVEVKE